MLTGHKYVAGHLESALKDLSKITLNLRRECNLEGTALGAPRQEYLYWIMILDYDLTLYDH